MHPVFERLRGGLIVSCQAQKGEPLHVPGYMARMALAAKIGGAVGIRSESPDDIRSIRAEVDLPIVGLWKIATPGCDVYITPTLDAVRAVREAGADIVALDATGRKNAWGEDAWRLIAVAKAAVPGILIMADISTEEEALRAEKEGADVISTTLSGYTSYSPRLKTADLDLLRALNGKLSIPYVAEGRIHTPELARAALDAGAFAVVVGGAITRPAEITKRFVEAIRGEN